MNPIDQPTIVGFVRHVNDVGEKKYHCVVVLLATADRTTMGARMQLYKTREVMEILDNSIGD
jgi:hypothetical protein